MDTFADYILDERDLASKMEITYYLAKRREYSLTNQLYLKQKLPECL